MDLNSRFDSFMKAVSTIECIDSIPVPPKYISPKKADYFGMGRSVIFEQKSINQEQVNKIQNEIEKHQNEEYYPVFYGQRDVNLVLENFPNKEEMKRKIFNKITKLIEGYLSNADKQILSTSKIFGISRYTGVLIILNDKIEVLSPEVIIHKLSQLLSQKKADGSLRFSKVSYILFISEAHLYRQKTPIALLLQNDLVLPHNKNVEEYMRYLIHSWSEFNGGRPAFIEDLDELLKHSKQRPELKKARLTRSEERKRWYKANRYMKNWSDDDVYKKCAEYIAAIGPFYTKGGPKMPPQMLGEATLAFTDFIVESNIRGLDIREIKRRYGYILNPRT